MPQVLNSKKSIAIIIATVMAIPFCICNAQNINVKDGLIFQASYDGDITGKEPKSINLFPSAPKIISYRYKSGNQILIDETANFRYKPNGIRKINNLEQFVIKGFEKSSPISLCFWFRINISNSTIKNTQLLEFKINSQSFVLTEVRKSQTLSIYSIAKKANIGTPKLISTISFPNSSEEWRLLTILLDQNSNLKFAISNSTSQTIASEPTIQLDTTNINNTEINLQFSQKIPGHLVFIDDVRIYDGVLSQEIIKAISTYDPFELTYPAKYQLAYTYKLLADQYYIKESDVTKSANTDVAVLQTAEKFYKASIDTLVNGLNLTAEVIDSIKNIDNPVWLKNKLDSLAENKIKNSIPFSANYDLLLLDAKYRLYLIKNNYSFWGKDFNDKPLYPVQEYNYFTNTFEKFNKTYVNIDALLKDNREQNDEQEEKEIQAQIAIHKSEIDKIKVDETQYKVGFYNQQLESIDSRLKGIEQQQKQLTRDVERKEDELKNLDAQIMSSLSQVVSSQVLGVNVDISKNWSDNFKTIGLKYLEGDTKLSASLLGSYKDVYDATNTARQYYEKGKSTIDAVKSISSGSITPDKLLKIGDAVAGSGIADEKWVSQWNSLKSDYPNLEDRYKKGKELLQKIEATSKKPNLQNVVDFVDWISEKDYMPENYKKDFEKFRGYRDAAYNSIKNKRYDDIINLGLKIYDDQNLKTEVNSIREKVKSLKPTFIMIEMIKKKEFQSLRDTMTSLLLSDQVIDFINPQIRNEFLFATLKKYLLEAPTINKDFLEEIYVSLINESPESFLNCFPINVREDLKKLLKVKTDKELAEKLKTIKLSDFAKEIKVTRDTLFIYGEPYIMDISKYLAIDKKLTNAIVRLYKKYPVLLKTLQTSTDPLQVYKVFEEVLIDKSKNSKTKSELFYQLAIKSIDTAQQKSIIEETTKFYIGNGIFQAATDSSETGNLIDKIPPVVDQNNPNEIAGENTYSGTSQNGDNSAAIRAMAAKALDMAFPGVGTGANTLLGIADKIFGGYQIVDQLRNIYDQKVNLNEAYIKLLDRYKDNEFNKQLALYETKIANASYDVMLQEHEGFSKMVNTIVKNKEDIRRKIAGELPMMFFYAERLRYYYQRLNKSSIFWYGSENSLNRIIFSDKNNRRLALDPDIKLYDWISTPDITSTREDLFTLFSYWSNLNALVTDGLTSNKLKYGDNISEISYKIFDIRTLNSKEWNDFERWKLYPNTPISFDLDLSLPVSASNKFGFDTTYSSIKTIQIIPIVFDNKNNPLNNLINVSNLGASINENGIVEPLGVRTRSSGDEFLTVDNNGNLIIPTYYFKNLKYRWDSPNNDYQPFNFEGYNLRSNWKLTIEPKQDANRISNIYFVAFYQYTKNYNNENLENNRLKYLYKLTIHNKLNDQREILNVSLDTFDTTITKDQLFQIYPKLEERERKVDGEDIVVVEIEPYTSINIDANGKAVKNGILVNKNSNSDSDNNRNKIPIQKKKKYFLSRKKYKS